MTNQVAPQQKAVALSKFLNSASIKTFLNDTLKDRAPEFVSNLLSLAETDVNLRNCDPDLLMRCAMNATALNLPLNKNLGYAYVIPYKDKSGAQIPQFQVGYKGLLQLAIRSGAYKTIHAVEVRKGEVEYDKFTGAIKFVKECPDAEIVGYVAYLELTTGFKKYYYMTAAQMEEHASQYSKMYQLDKKNKTKYSKWSDPLVRNKMALKTVLKGLLSMYGVLSTEIQLALDKDSNEETQQETGPRISVEAETVEDQSEPNEPEDTVNI